MQSVDRLISVLESVAANGAASSAAEVADETGLSLSTVSRLMIAFADAGLLHRSHRDRRYTLGPRLYALARAAGSQLDAVTVARPLLEQLRDVTGETVSLHVLRGHQRVCIAEVPSLHEVRRVVPVGHAEPVLGSATGAVLLAGRPLEEQQSDLDAIGPAPAERQRFEPLLAHARKHGWVIVSDGFVAGLTGLSAAVSDSGGTSMAISVSGPTVRFPREVALSHVDEVQRAAQTIAATIFPDGR